MKRVDLNDYTNSHLSAPFPGQDGLWLFRAEGSWTKFHEFTGRYADAVKSLPAGSWILLP